jgi:hypothetical protein
MKTNRLILSNGLLVFLVIIALSVKAFPSAEDHKIQASFLDPGNASSSDTKADLTGTLQNWMENGSYWEKMAPCEDSNSTLKKSDTKVYPEKQLSDILKNWMKTGEYWAKKVITQSKKD